MTHPMIERCARALREALKVRPYGGYDRGYNEAFYGPAPKAGRYEIRDERTNRIVHQTNDEAEHHALFDLLTDAYRVRAVLQALRNPTEDMIEAAVATPGMKAVNDLIMLQAARGYPLPPEAMQDGKSPLGQAWAAMLDRTLTEQPSGEGL